ncbi:MAG TPA: hypothetical protein V6C97_30235 [Oculatellaceae cyanobacterium]
MSFEVPALIVAIAGLLQIFFLPGHPKEYNLDTIIEPDTAVPISGHSESGTHEERVALSNPIAATPSPSPDVQAHPLEPSPGALTVCVFVGG